MQIKYGFAVVALAATVLTPPASGQTDTETAWTLMFYMAVDNSVEAELDWFRDYPRRFAPGNELEGR